MATTPLQGWTVPAGSQAPATAADMAALGGAAEKQAVMVYATTAAMDTAIPTANRKAGMIAWIANLGRHVRVTSDAQSGTLGPLSLLGSVVVGTALVGTYDPSKPLKAWAINGAYSTDASGDATILDSAAIGSGCVLGGSVSGADVYAVNGPLRAVSGALKMRVFNNGSTALVSSAAALQGIVIGQ